jgi:macrolide transport system ATP-binding/permease protein
MVTPLLALKGVCRDFPAGDGVVSVLKDVNLGINAGEMVAIIGASGSGKTTLMNILGCLDRPTAGSYQVAGCDTCSLDAGETARLRRDYFGFVFQRYHLLPDLSAFANVEIPAIYAGVERTERHRQVTAILQRLGLGDRIAHRPSQLSGGQQQRVSIARALVNGGLVILADEPTGALDSQRGEEVMRLLGELNASGHTVIVVTHDPRVAAHARRIIEISDGSVIADTTRDISASSGADGRALPAPGPSARVRLDRLLEAGRMALLSMKAHRLRTLLTMLGIIIGIASVVCAVALGEGSRQRVLDNISELGTNTLEIYRGREPGGMPSVGAPLSPADADAIAGEPYADSVTPVISTGANLRYRHITSNARVVGVGKHFFKVKGMKLAEGRVFSDDDIQMSAQEAVIDRATRNKLFAADANAVGEVVFLDRMPLRIIGVMEKSDISYSGMDSLSIWIPYTAVLARMEAKVSLDVIVVRVSDSVSSQAAETYVTAFLQGRHGTIDFHISNNGSVRRTIENADATLNLLITSIALISLLVGGIGVMNIMLVSVKERTREIGVRMAVGARPDDILQQFLIEAVLVCLIGGVLGIALSFIVGLFFSGHDNDYRMIFSTAAIVTAFATCTLVGIASGFVPARNAARLDPVDALARDS